jgi:hypothetical protein
MPETPNDIQWGGNSPADIKWGAAPAPEPTPSRLRRLVADPAISAVKGAIGLPEAAVGMANIVTGGLAGKAADAVGFRPAAAKATLDTLYSPEQQQANQEVQRVEGFLPTAKAMLRNPSTIIHTAIESSAPMLGGAAVAKRLIAGGTAPIIAAATGEGAVSAGSTAEQIRQETGDLTGKQGLIAATSGAATGALGLAGGKLAKKMGVVDLDTVLAGGERVSKAGVAKATAGGMLSEGLLEEAPQSAQEQAAANLATGKPVTEGVSKAAATGAVTGGAMGGGFNAALGVAGIGQRALERKARLAELATLQPEEQRAAIQDLAAEIHVDNPAAAAAMTATTLDRLDAGETALDAETQAAIDELTRAPEAAPTREGILESLQESVASGGEVNPLEVVAAKEEAKVAEVLTPKVAAPVTDPSLIRAQSWAQAGRVVLKDGLNPDAEVAAHLDDMGLTLVRGDRADMTEGGNVARREWVVQEKAVEGLAPILLDSAVNSGTGTDEGKALTARAKAEIAQGNFDTATTKKGMKLQLVHFEDDNGSRTVKAFKADGVEVGSLNYETVTMDDGRAWNPNVEVGAPYRRKGVASALYDAAEARGGIIPAVDQEGQVRSVEGQAFRDARAGIKPASIKMMITNAERQQLYARGYTESGVDKMKPAEAAQILATPPAYAPLADGEQRLAYEGNPNLMVKRVGNQIAMADITTKEVLGVAQIKNGKVGGWVEGKEPATAEERSQIKRVLDEHLGVDAPRFARVASLADAGIPKSVVGSIRSMMAQDTKAGRLKLAESITDAELAQVSAATWKQIGVQEAIDKEVSRMAAKVADPETPQFIRDNLSNPETIERRVNSIKKTWLAFHVAQGVDEGRFSRSTGAAGLPKAEIEAHLAPAIKSLKVPVTIVESASEIKGLATDVEFTGVFYKGGIYLNAANLRSLQEAEDVLLRHEIRHAGLRTLLGKDGLDKVLAKAWGDLGSGVREFAKGRGIDTKTKAGKLEATEEYIVELARTDSKSPVWDRFVEILRAVLRKLGFQVKYSDAELRSLVARAGEAMIVEGETRFSAAWHGSPHTFDKFSTKAMGTGEGAQILAESYEEDYGKAEIKWVDDEAANHNYVIFNDEDVKIEARFSRALKNPKDLVDKLSGGVARRALSDVSGNIWRYIMAVDRTIELAKSMPIYAPIKDLLGQYVVLRKAKAAATNVPLTYGHQIAAEVSKAFKTDAEVETLNTLMAKATIYELHADGRNAGWNEKSWKESGKEEKTGLTLGQARAELASLWKPLTAAQKDAHRKMIDHMRVLFDQLLAAELEPLRTAYGEEMFSAAEDLDLDDESADPDLRELALLIADKKSRGQLKGDYTPLMRHGNHIVRTLDAEGNRLALRSFESKQAAIDEVAAIRAKGLTAKYDLIPESSKAQANIPLAFLDKMRRAAEARGITGDALEQLMDDFTAARVQTLPRTSLAGTTLQREGVEGYDTDMVRAYASYTNKAGQAIAQAKYGRQIEQTFRDMSNVIQAHSEREDSEPHALERMSSLRDMLYKQDKAQEVERVNDLVKALGKSAFIWYLSSPSIYAVQWAQPFITTIPKMASKYGFGKAFAAYTREAKHFLAGRFSDANIDEFNTKHENAGERLYQLIEEERQAQAAAEPKKAAGIRKAMRVLYDGFDDAGKKLLILKVLGLQGVLDISSSHEMMDLITGASDGQKTLNMVTSKLAFFMQKSETGSRRAAAVSSFQMALDNGKDFVEANDYAAEMIGDTLGDFTSQNRPELLRGNLGRVIGQFRFYQIHMLGKTVQLMKDAYQEKGWGEKRKEMAFMLGMSMSLAGAAGTPAAMLATSAPVTAILAGLSMAFGDPDDPWDLERDFAAAARDALGDDAGNVFLKGLPSLLGMDISKRIGMGGLGNIINGDPPPGLSAEQRAQWAAGRLLGPSFGMATDAMKSYDAVSQGEWVEAFKVSTPKPVKDLFKAAALYQHGAMGGGGRTIVQPEDISPTSIALQALGVNPLEVALAQEERREISALSTQLRQRRSLLLKRVTDATLENDMDARDEALEGINAWGLKQPGLKITQGELLEALKRGRKARAGTLTRQEQMVQGMLRE